jgi:sirohydrochlorin cobaltochelatase
MNRSAASAIILFAHGARDPEWARPIEAIKVRIEQRLPGTPVMLAFLEFIRPSLDVAIESLIATGAQRIDVIPVFMAQGGHVKRDVPLILDALRSRHAGITIHLAPAVGEAASIIDAIADWVIQRARQSAS